MQDPNPEPRDARKGPYGVRFLRPLESDDVSRTRGGTVLVFVALYVALVILVPLALSAVLSFRAVHRGRDCPLCRRETIWLRSRWFGPLVRLGGGHVLQRRWCPGCGWEGVARLSVLRPALPGELRSPALPIAPPGAETIDLRELHVNGDSWRVRLECWHEEGRWFGRLLFEGPSGRRWTDSMRPFSGRSHLAVLDQALALSDRILVWRLREVVSD